VGRKLDEDEAERIDHRSGEIYDDLNVTPRPTEGATALLCALEESDLVWAIATSSRAQQTRVSVDALELPEQPLIVDGSHVEHAKPAPDLLLLAADQIGREPAECWYVGDSTWDMLAADTAGMTAIGVAYGAASEEELVAAGAVAVTDLETLGAELQRRGLLAVSSAGRERPPTSATARARAR
jgi:HAD superfamily hydrolase (TIGR01509 family)